MNKRSTLFFTDCSTRTLVSWVTVVFGDSTGGDKTSEQRDQPDRGYEPSELPGT